MNKIIIISLMFFSAIAISAEVASSSLQREMLNAAKKSVLKTCRSNSEVIFSSSAQGHDVYEEVDADGEIIYEFSPKLTGVAACGYRDKTLLIQWTVNTTVGITGNLKVGRVNKTIFSTDKLKL